MHALSLQFNSGDSGLQLAWYFDKDGSLRSLGRFPKESKSVFAPLAESKFLRHVTSVEHRLPFGSHVITFANFANAGLESKKSVIKPLISFRCPRCPMLIPDGKGRSLRIPGSSADPEDKDKHYGVRTVLRTPRWEGHKTENASCRRIFRLPSTSPHQSARGSRVLSPN